MLSSHKTIKLNVGILPKSSGPGLGEVLRMETYSMCPLGPDEWRLVLGRDDSKEKFSYILTWSRSRAVWHILQLTLFP